MAGIVRTVTVLLLSSLSLSAAGAPQSFVGVISDSECGRSHAGMRMGETDAECVRACLDAHGASYVLWDGTRSYDLSDQRMPAPFAGRRVTVTGSLEASGTRIDVAEIKARD